MTEKRLRYYWDEGERQKSALSYGKPTESSQVYKAFIGDIAKRLLSGTLEEAWKIYEVDKHILAIHPEYESAHPELGKKILIDYLNKAAVYRQQHNAIFNTATRMANPSTKVQMARMARTYQSYLSDNFLLVAAPSHQDNPQLWESHIGQPVSVWGEIIPSWAKISQSGLAMSSVINPEHDLTQYILNQSDYPKAITGLTAHEYGGHGIIDKAIVDILGPEANSISEGWAVFIAKDHAIPTFDQKTITEAILNPCVEESAMYKVLPGLLSLKFDELKTSRPEVNDTYLLAIFALGLIESANITYAEVVARGTDKYNVLAYFLLTYLINTRTNLALLSHLTSGLTPQARIFDTPMFKGIS